MNRHLPFFRDVHDSTQRAARVLGDRRVPLRLVDILNVSRRAQTIAVVAVSSLAALAVARAFAAADDAQSEWKGSERAYMLLAPVEDGGEITADSVREVLLPPALAPDGRIDIVRPGMRARIALPAHVVLVTAMLDVHVDYPSSWRVVAFPSGTAIPPVSSGDAVDVIVGTEVLVEAAVVASVSPLTLAVPPERAPDVAAAVRLGEVSVLAR